MTLSTQRITSPARAAEIIRDGGLVAFPTETVFGLGVDATNHEAVTRLFEAKGRPSNNPLIVHLGDVDGWKLAAAELTEHAAALLAAYAPGPITVVLPKHPAISPLVTAGLHTIGIRIPKHPIALEILRAANVPVAAPSANLSGRPSGTTWNAVLEDLDGRVDAVFCEGSSSIGIESTVVDCCGTVPIVLRPGAISIEQVRAVVPQATELQPNTASPTETNRVNSPGLLHPHYQPAARVVLIEELHELPTDELNNAAYCGTTQFPATAKFALAAVYESLDEYAANFYEFLRKVDRQSITTVYMESAKPVGIGKALLDRQRRAAQQ